VSAARKRGWAAEGFAGSAVLGLTICAYASVVWLAFGAVEVVPAMKALTWQMVLYAVLSLTVIRMVPVAVALAGARLGRATVALVGWFGPQGLASVVFALLALEDLGGAVAGRAVAVITITVLLSVVHGVTAEPLAAWYAKSLAHPPDGNSGAQMRDIPDRRLVRGARNRG
jgi:sodium/hydrogen antiporter